MSIQASHLGFVPYARALELQEAMVRARAARETGDWLLFPDHPAVLTVGRNPSPGNLRVERAALERLGIELHEVARGGDITWHGPGQLVGYAICDLTARGRDLHRFLRAVEDGIINSLQHLEIDGVRVPGRTGVWVSGKKIASIGIAVRRWVSYHGFALNVAPDLSAFEIIHPCGLQGIQMTSLAALMGQAPVMERVRRLVADHMAEALGLDPVEWVGAQEVWRVAGSQADNSAEGSPAARRLAALE